MVTESFDINKTNQIIDDKLVGYHDIQSLPIKRGDTILIPKDTLYHSMKDGDIHITKKSYKVKVDHLINGCQYVDRGKKIIHNPEVSWVGSGGWWHRADINDVEKVNE